MGLGFSNLMLRSAANVGSLKPRSANETVALVADVVKPKLREKVSCFGGEDSRESVDRQFECETGRGSRLGAATIPGNVAASLREAEQRGNDAMISNRFPFFCLAGARQLRSRDRRQDLMPHPGEG